MSKSPTENSKKPKQYNRLPLLNFRISPQLSEAIDEHVKATGTSRAALMRRSIARELGRPDLSSVHPALRRGEGSDMT